MDNFEITCTRTNQSEVHIFAAGSPTCLCGKVNYAEPPFPEDFWNQMDAAMSTAYGIDETAPWTERDEREWEKLKRHAKNYGGELYKHSPSTGRIDGSKPNPSNGATLDIARYCKICGKSEHDCVYGDQAKAGFHGFVADIPYDWDGKLTRGEDGKLRFPNGDVFHGCELCDGEDECTC